ncbi:MAG: hypothetical protein Q9162_002820 [Coniocarpon cinnabarinum]
MDSPSLTGSVATLLTERGAHSSHPNFGHLTLLVFEAVLEVVCVSLPGYIVARRGMFGADAQKFVANLNMTLFTPCLIFTKLASQLNGDRLIELIIIPFILLAQTAISYVAARVCSWAFRMRKKPQENFIVAMAVFGNSNSLPLSLVISLSHTISGLHWDKVPDDNDNEVAARGILYLLIFSQLGQAVRWSWGMNSLLKPLDHYTPSERGDILQDEEVIRQPYSDESPRESIDESNSNSDTASPDSALDTLANPSIIPSPTSSNDHSQQQSLMRKPNGDVVLDRVSSAVPNLDGAPFRRPRPLIRRQTTSGAPDWMQRLGDKLAIRYNKSTSNVKQRSANLFDAFPKPLQRSLQAIWKVVRYIASCLNVPLAAILLAVIVALTPPLQRFFFEKGTFVNNSVTSALVAMGNVAVPLILVVLGANLARNTLPDESVEEVGTKNEQAKMLYLSLICRMLIPTVIMTPILAIMAKYVPVSIIDDPIFLIVCFLLSGAPSALQLAQMCQVNGVFIGVVSRLLFHSYVLWILPSTLILVLLALETVEWAK